MSLFAVPAAAITFATWAVYVGGLASLQSDCDVDGLTTRGLSDPMLPCSKAYRYNWFVLSWEFVIVMILAGAAVSGKLAHARTALVGLFAVGTMLYIDVSNQFLNGQSIDYYTDGTPLHRIRTVTAGAIMTALMNAVVILIVGYADGIDKPVAEKAENPV